MVAVSLLHGYARIVVFSAFFWSGIGGDGDRVSGVQTSSTPRTTEGLLEIVHNLAREVAELKEAQVKDWARLGRSEWRGQNLHLDPDRIVQEEIVQIRQQVSEIKQHLLQLDDSTSTLRLEVMQLVSGRREILEEMVRLRDAHRALDGGILKADISMTKLNSKAKTVEGRVLVVEKSVQLLQDKHQSLLACCGNLDTKLAVVSKKSENLLNAFDNRRYFVRDKPSPGTQALPANQIPQQDDSRISQPDGAVSDAIVVTVKDRSDEEFSGDGEISVTVEGAVDGISADEDFVLLSGMDDVTTSPGRGDVTRTSMEGANETVDTFSGTTQDGVDTLTPTTATTFSAPTLTKASISDPTTPTTPCCSPPDLSSVYRRLEDIEERLNNSFSAYITDELMKVGAVLELSTAKRDEDLQQLQGNVTNINATVFRLAGHLATLRLDDFMQRLQSSLVKFTSNVLTLEQWRESSEHSESVSKNQELRLSELTSRVQETSEVVGNVQHTLQDFQGLSERQFRVLQAHVIRLNNTLQDLQEQVAQVLQSQSLSTNRNGANNYGLAGKPIDDLLTSRVENLALQVVFSDNRLANLENRVLNTTLASCQKANNELLQDASIVRLDQNMADAQRDMASVQETVTRLDLGIYRLHANIKATQEMTRKVQTEVSEMAGVSANVQILRREVDNLLFQLPADCDDYYHRNNRRSGEYIIHPKTAARSVKVQCIMQHPRRHHRRYNDYSDEDSIDSAGGGWTVIQQRKTGEVNFTRSWAEYAVGFGSASSEYWLGNEYLHMLTAHRNYTLRVQMRDVFDRRWFAVYHSFVVSSKEDDYRLGLSGFQGNATDTLNYSAGMTFSTYDRDTDMSSSPCARYNGGGWWYRHCQITNLNGPYDVGMIWFHRGLQDWLQLREATLMIRPLV